MPTQTLSRAEQIRIDDAAWGNSSSRQDSGVTRKRVIIDTTQQKQQKRSAMERDARIDARQSNANCALLSFMERWLTLLSFAAPPTIMADSYLFRPGMQ